MSAEKFNDHKRVKILAYYLPQFHAIPENDEWWGKGHTEWTTLKKENKLSENLQPLNDNYYNLLDEKTVLWQTELAKTYGVYGFVYYHYYFLGKKLLEKPAENLLNNKNIDQKFCFFWANANWTKGWTSLEGYKTILMKQKYGGEEDWQRHFDYLLPFLKDDRYIKVNNKPLFIFYQDFEEKETMCKFFNDYASKCGFDGIFFAQSTQKIERSVLNTLPNGNDAIILREPDISFFHNRLTFVARGVGKLRRLLLGQQSDSFLMLKEYNGNNHTKITVRNADFFCKKIRKTGLKCWLGAYSGWDNSSRHGERGFKLTPISDKSYVWYLTKLKKIAEKENVEFIFFNAWNEWTEGMILEPDTRNQYRFLEGIRRVFAEK